MIRRYFHDLLFTSDCRFVLIIGWVMAACLTPVVYLHESADLPGKVPDVEGKIVLIVDFLFPLVFPIFMETAEWFLKRRARQDDERSLL